MAITREKKKAILGDLKDSLEKAKSAVFVNFHGVTVADVSAMRRALRAEKIGYKVAKKSLIGLALDDQKIEGDRPEFKGELAVAYGEDLVAPAREVYNFEKKFEGKVSILGGIFEGKYKSKVEMTEIAKIPGQDTLRGMFVNIINSPIQRLVIALDQIAATKS